MAEMGEGDNDLQMGAFPLPSLFTRGSDLYSIFPSTASFRKHQKRLKQQLEIYQMFRKHQYVT